MPPPRRIIPGRRPAALPGGGRKKPPPSQTVAKCCEEPDIQDRDGAKIFTNCFTQISEANIVSDVTFEESASGAATVQGGFIGENSRHANTINTNAFRRMGGGERNNIEEIRRKGQQELQSIYPRVPITDAQIVTQAMSIWGVAANNNFTAGRTLSEVVGACLYASCRRSPDNEVLLIDIAEVIKINVFRLGEVYKTMCKELYIGKGDLHFQHMMDIENLILKYCKRLEFGPATNQVAEDAIKIVRRMKRDWIATGRHPSGLCGACIILAARMNNFKRTVREVVYVSKIADITIAKRIDEFRRTKSAALTVTQFRQYSERLKHQHDPPSIHDSEIRAKKLEDKKRKRQAAVNERLGLEGPIVVDDQIDSNSMTGTPEPPDTEEAERRKRARTSEPSMSAQAEPRFDADGFAIPAIPVRPVIIDPALVEVPEMVDEEVIPKKRGRPKKVAPAPVQISEEELMIESELQQQIEEALDDTEVNQQRDKLLKEHEEARSKASAITQRELDGQRIQARRLASGITWHNSTVHNELELVTAEQLAEEFKDDPEVENCVLSGQAAIEKEKIWLYHNEDWLREQYEKELLKKIAAAKGANKPKNGRKKKSKMGEPLLTAAGTPAETPADATAAMLAKHAGPGFSKFVDYEALGKVYGNESRAGSRAGSLAPSQPPSQAGSPSRDSTPAVGPGASPPANGLASPEATQGQEEAAAPIREKSVPAPDMPSPPPTQAQQPDAVQGAQQEDETMQEDNDDEDEPVEDEPEEDDNTRPRYPGGYEDEDDDDYGDRDYGADDYGEEGYDDAIDPLGGPSIGAW
jgi:transcription factor IIIB subunit 2